MAALEMLYSVRDAVERGVLWETLVGFRWLNVTTGVMRRALEVQGLLTARGHHRVSLPDLIVAATAELNGAVVLHYDKDYDVIAAVTGQPAEWVIPRGSGG
jgi:predicted nucleic acid-binding protein